MDDNIESLKNFWEKSMDAETRQAIFERDPVFRAFDRSSIAEVLSGKALRLDVEKIVYVQDRLDHFEAVEGDQCIRDVFENTTNRNVRSHKLMRILKERLRDMAESNVNCREYLGKLGGGKVSQPAPARESPELREESSGWVSMPPQYLQMSPDLDEEAIINIRSEPHFDAQVIGSIGFHDRILRLGMQDDWARVRDDRFGDGWIITRSSGQTILLPVDSSGEPQNVDLPRSSWLSEGSQNGENCGMSANLSDIPTSQSKEVLSSQPLRSSYSTNESSTPYQTVPQMSSGVDLQQMVSMAEHKKLEHRVLQLESDLRALRLLLRSWSLDAPLHSV